MILVLFSWDPFVRFLVNLDGCVNRGNCTDFFDRVKKDGRDQSAQYVVPCHYDFFTESAFLNYDPDGSTKLYLLLGAILPPSLFFLSLLVTYIIHAIVEVSLNPDLILKNIWKICHLMALKSHFTYLSPIYVHFWMLMLNSLV